MPSNNTATRPLARVRIALYALASLALATAGCFADGPTGIGWTIVLFAGSALLADAADYADHARRHPVRTTPGTIRRDRLGLLLTRAERGVLAEGEAAELRQLVAAEIHAADQARIQAANARRPEPAPPVVPPGCQPQDCCGAPTAHPDASQ
ncbi:hypothetical protein ACWGDX_02955 [Streptomyces sp. NPDC055025]